MNTNFLNSVTNFLKKRTFEFIGLILISTSIGLAIAFTTYSPEDPSFVYGDKDFEIKWTSKLLSLFNAKAVIKPERPSPIMQILCFFI